MATSWAGKEAGATEAATLLMNSNKISFSALPVIDVLQLAAVLDDFALPIHEACAAVIRRLQVPLLPPDVGGRICVVGHIISPITPGGIIHI